MIRGENPGEHDSRASLLPLGLILALGLLLRLYHLNHPPVDFLSWRETQTLMVARNFYREGMNLFSPSVDWRTTVEVAPKGTVGGTELMVVPYLTACLYHVFGLRYWIGRVAPILFALVGTAYFYRLVERFYGRRRAALSALLLTVSPYFLFCGRAHMPEPFAFAMFFAALHYYARWIESDANAGFCLAALACVLTLLGKPPLVIIAVPMGFLTLRRYGWRAFRRPRLYLFALLVGLPAALYLLYSWKVLIPEAGLSFAQPGLLGYRRYLTDPAYYVDVGKTAALYALTPPVALLALLALCFRPDAARKYFVHAWCLGALALFLLMPGGCRANGYYHMVLAPPAVVLAAGALEAGLNRRRLRVCTVAALLAAAGWSLHVAARLYEPQDLAAYHCGTWLEANTPADTLVLSASPNPATLYFADRVGWTTWSETYGKDAMFDHDLVNSVAGLGAAVLAVSDPWFDNPYYPQYQDIRDDLYDTYLCRHDEDFVVFSLRNRADLGLPEDGRIAFGTPEGRKYLRGTWGPIQEFEDGARFVTMGPAAVSRIRFSAPGPVNRIYLDMASAMPDQRLTIGLNGESAGALDLAKPRDRGKALIEPQDPAARQAPWTVSLEADSQNRDGVSILLYGIEVEAVR